MSLKSLESIWYTRCPVPTPLGIAVQLGWIRKEFARHGVTVHALQETSDLALRESHFDHHLANSFRQGGSVPAIWARSRGADTRVIGFNWVDESQLVIALPESGIRRPEDLKGRRLGLPLHQVSIDHGRASALRGFISTLELVDLGAEDAEFVDVPVESRTIGWTASGTPKPGGSYATLVSALLKGEVDAIFVKGARGVETATLLGANIIMDLRRHPDPFVRVNNGAPRPITVDAGLLRDRPDIVTAFLARIVAVGQWAASHPAETLEYVARETGAAWDWVRKAYGYDLHLRQTTDLDEISIQALEYYKDFLLRWGFIREDFSIRDWIDPAPLDAILRHNSRRVA
ncbi:MAG TPA: ABC transporter substrate-binding protein [Methylophilaceae bacterium]|jgi:ABC-type nitrate/sulfonate/bicarbonate transport system substrate-binding protein